MKSGEMIFKNTWRSMVNKLEQLLNVSTNLEELIGGGDDEANHSLADNALIKTIEILSKGSSQDIKSAVELIIKNYRAIDKYYN